MSQSNSPDPPNPLTDPKIQLEITETPSPQLHTSQYPPNSQNIILDQSSQQSFQYEKQQFLNSLNRTISDKIIEKYEQDSQYAVNNLQLQGATNRKSPFPTASQLDQMMNMSDLVDVGDSSSMMIDEMVGNLGESGGGLGEEQSGSQISMNKDLSTIRVMKMLESQRNNGGDGDFDAEQVMEKQIADFQVDQQDSMSDQKITSTSLSNTNVNFEDIQNIKMPQNIESTLESGIDTTNQNIPFTELYNKNMIQGGENKNYIIEEINSPIQQQPPLEEEKEEISHSTKRLQSQKKSPNSKMTSFSAKEFIEDQFYSQNKENQINLINQPSLEHTEESQIQNTSQQQFNSTDNNMKKIDDYSSYLESSATKFQKTQKSHQTTDSNPKFLKIPKLSLTPQSLIPPPQPQSTHIKHQKIQKSQDQATPMLTPKDPPNTNMHHKMRHYIDLIKNMSEDKILNINHKKLEQKIWRISQEGFGRYQLLLNSQMGLYTQDNPMIKLSSSKMQMISQDLSEVQSFTSEYKKYVKKSKQKIDEMGLRNQQMLQQSQQYDQIDLDELNPLESQVIGGGKFQDVYEMALSRKMQKTGNLDVCDRPMGQVFDRIRIQSLQSSVAELDESQEQDPPVLGEQISDFLQDVYVRAITDITQIKQEQGRRGEDLPKMAILEEEEFVDPSDATPLNDDHDAPAPTLHQKRPKNLANRNSVKNPQKIVKILPKNTQQKIQMQMTDQAQNGLIHQDDPLQQISPKPYFVTSDPQINPTDLILQEYQKIKQQKSGQEIIKDIIQNKQQQYRINHLIKLKNAAQLQQLLLKIQQLNMKIKQKNTPISMSTNSQIEFKKQQLKKLINMNKEQSEVIQQHEIQMKIKCKKLKSLQQVVHSQKYIQTEVIQKTHDQQQAEIHKLKKKELDQQDLKQNIAQNLSQFNNEFQEQQTKLKQTIQCKQQELYLLNLQLQDLKNDLKGLKQESELINELYKEQMQQIEQEDIQKKNQYLIMKNKQLVLQEYNKQLQINQNKQNAYQKLLREIKEKLEKQRALRKDIQAKYTIIKLHKKAYEKLIRQKELKAEYGIESMESLSLSDLEEEVEILFTQQTSSSNTNSRVYDYEAKQRLKKNGKFKSQKEIKMEENQRIQKSQKSDFQEPAKKGK